MATMPISYSFSNGNPANALEVNQNFLDVKGFVESALVQVDGTVQLPSAAIADNSITTPKILDSSVTSAKIVDGTIVAGDIADSTITISKFAPSVVSSGTWTPVATYNHSSGNGSYYMVGQIMFFEGVVFLTGTVNSSNTISIPLPTGDYGTTSGSIEVYWTGGYFGTSYYSGRTLVGFGYITPYVVSGSGFMTSFSNSYSGQNVTGSYIRFNGSIRKYS